MSENQPGVSWKEYVDTRFEGQDKAINAALAATKEATAAALASQKEAVTKAENASEKRFESVNEFRKTLDDQQKTLMPRLEAELLLKGMSDRMKVLEDAKLSSTGGQTGAKNLWAIIVGVLGVASLIAGWVITLTK